MKLNEHDFIAMAYLATVVPLPDSKVFIKGWESLQRRQLTIGQILVESEGLHTWKRWAGANKRTLDMVVFVLENNAKFRYLKRYFDEIRIIPEQKPSESGEKTSESGKQLSFFDLIGTAPPDAMDHIKPKGGS